jgi:mitogen-activated protein kinase kinase kinase
MAALRPMPHQQGSQLSPTSSTSSRTTTPTSPHFHSHQRSQSSLSRPVVGHAYAQPGSRPSTSTGAGSILHPRPITPALYRAPSNQPFLAYVKSWGEDEINQFLSIFNCSHHAAAFQRNDIDGKCILDLDTNNLKEIGVVKIGERIKIHNGIKDLRKRAANSNQHAQLRSTSRIELRLNGAATPPLDNVPSPTTNGSLYTRDNHPASGLKRLGSARPPPLDLHTQQARSNIPQAYQNVPTSIDSRTVTTPKAIPSHPPVPSRNVSSTSTASDVTVVPASHGSTITAISSVPAPAPAPTRGLNLRAPPARDAGRRSPSPVNTDPTQFADRPLPPNPSQSSAAEYASKIRYAEGRTPTAATHESAGQQKAQGPPSERRNQPPPIIIRPDLSHRKHPSLGATPGGRPNSPVKPKLQTGGRANTSSGTVHPFAANRAPREEERRASPPDSHLPPQMVSNNSHGSSGSNRSNRNAGYVVGTGLGVAVHRSASAVTPPHGSTGRRETGGSGSGTLSLEDLRKQLVKFINSEDGTTRTVNVSSCSSGVEVLERVLKKFGKWGTGTAVTTDTESDEDGDQLEIDGWGVYEDIENDESQCGT